MELDLNKLVRNAVLGGIALGIGITHYVNRTQRHAEEKRTLEWRLEREKNRRTTKY